jgi:hypothetical protein
MHHQMAAVRVQAAWRGYRTRGEYLYRRALHNGAAVMIQRKWRTHKALNSLLTAGTAGVGSALNSLTSPGTSVMGYSVEVFHTTSTVAAPVPLAPSYGPSHQAAALVIQTHWRGYCGRWAALQKRAVETAAAEVIQEWWRSRRALWAARAARAAKLQADRAAELKAHQDALDAARRAADDEAARLEALRAARLAEEAKPRVVAVVPRKKRVWTRDTAATEIQRHVRGGQCRRLLAVTQTRALCSFAVAVPLKHAKPAQAVAHHHSLKHSTASLALSLTAAFTARTANPKPVPPPQATVLPSQPPPAKLGQHLMDTYHQLGEAAALEAAMKEALVWSAWMVPTHGAGVESAAHEASGAAHREHVRGAAKANGDGPEHTAATTRVAQSLAGKVAAEVAAAVQPSAGQAASMQQARLGDGEVNTVSGAVRAAAGTGKPGALASARAAAPALPAPAAARYTIPSGNGKPTSAKVRGQGLTRPAAAKVMQTAARRWRARRVAAILRARAAVKALPAGAPAEKAAAAQLALGTALERLADAAGAETCFQAAGALVPSDKAPLRALVALHEKKFTSAADCCAPRHRGTPADAAKLEAARAALEGRPSGDVLGNAQAMANQAMAQTQEAFSSMFSALDVGGWMKGPTPVAAR